MLFALFSYADGADMKENNTDKKYGVTGRALLFAATIVWGSSFVILKDTLAMLGNGNFTFFVLACRFLIAGVIFSAVSLRRFSKLDKKTALRGILLGVILFAAYSVQTIALRFTTPSKNAFLTEIYCVLVPFLSWLILKKRPSAKNFVAAGICLTGVLIIAFFGRVETGSNETLGDWLTVVCGLFYALQMVYIAKYREDDSMLLLTVEILTAAVLCSLTSAIFEFPRHYNELQLTFEAGWKILYLGIMATCFAQFAQLYGQKWTTATTTSIIMCFEGVFGVVFELIFGYNNLNAYIIIGFSLIFLTLIVNETDWGGIRRKIEERKVRKK